MTVKDREGTFASNLATHYHVGPGPSVHHGPAATKGEWGPPHGPEEAPMELGAAYWVPGGLITEGSIYVGTTSVQLTPLTTRALFDESGQVTILVPGHHVPTGSWPFGAESRPAPRTGDVGAALGRIVAPRPAHGFRDLLTYFLSNLVEAAEAAEPPAVERPHQEAVGWIKTTTGFSWERVGRLVGVSRQAVNAWRQGGPIADAHHRRLLEVRDVLERAAKRNPKPGGLAAWLDTPRGADGKTPADLIEAGEIGKARLLALSSPSRGVKTPPEWARRGAREAYLNSRERVRALPPEREELSEEASEDRDDE